MTDLRFAFRQLAKSGSFTAVAITILALGIGLNTAMFGLLNELILRPLPYPERDQLVRVDRTTPQEPAATHFSLDALDLQRETSDFLRIGLYRSWGFTLDEPGRTPVAVNGIRADAEFFQVLGLPPLLGRTFLPEENLPGSDVIVLGHDFWMAQYGGDREIVGRDIQIDGRSTTVIGVMPDSFRSIALWGPGEVILPIGITELEKTNRTDSGFGLVGRFGDELSLEQLNTRLATVARRMAETRSADQREDGLRAVDLQSVTQSPQALIFGGMMLALTGFVLLIVCGNLANLQLARGSNRTREFAVRAALGASRSQLLRPLLLESILLAGAGGLLGVLVSTWASEWMVRQLSADLPFNLTVSTDWRVVVFAVTLSMITGVLSGLFPAWLTSRVKVNDALKSGTRGATGDRGQHFLRDSLIVGQFASALLLLACAGFFMRGLDYLNARDPGWETAGLTQATMNIPPARYETPEQSYAFFTQLQERLRALPGATESTVAWALPVFQYLTTRKYIVDGREPPPPGREPVAFVNGVEPNYLDAIGGDLVAGRSFTSADRPGSPLVVMINESMARTLFPEENPVGQRLRLPDAPESPPVEIVGVFADLNMAAIPTPPTTPFQVHLPLAQECWNYATVVVRSDNAAAMVEPLRQAVAEIDPTIALQLLNTTEEVAAIGLRVMQLSTRLLWGFGLLGLLLAALGIYGVIARLVTQRSPEIGVRMALGASWRDILWMVLRSGLRLVGIGAAVGLVLSVASAFGLQAAFPAPDEASAGIDYLTLGAVTALLTVVAAVACYLPALRATRVDPMIALRAE